MACSPLEATTTISSPGSRRLPSQASLPAGTRPSADPATSIWRASTSPDKVGDSPPTQAAPTDSQARCHPVTSDRWRGARIPVGGAGGEVGVERERQGSDTTEVVHNGGDGVDADGVPAIEPEGTLDLAGDHRLGPEAFEHDGKGEPADFERAWPARQGKRRRRWHRGALGRASVAAAAAIARRLAASSVS